MGRYFEVGDIPDEEVLLQTWGYIQIWGRYGIMKFGIFFLKFGECVSTWG